MAKLTGPQKAAILLLSLGEDAAAEVMKNLSEDEMREVMAMVARYQDYTEADVARVLNEYHQRTTGPAEPPKVAPETKMAFLDKTLGRALGEERSKVLLGQIVDSPKGGALQRLKWHAPQTIAQVIQNEQPQVIAVILACFDEPELAARVMGALPQGLRGQVMSRFQRIKGIQPDWLEEVEASLQGLFAQAAAQPPAPEGVRKVAAVLGTEALEEGPGAQRAAKVLGELQRMNPQVAGAVRGQRVAFHEFIRIDAFGIQKILEQAHMDDVIMALRTADDAVREHILGNISPPTAHRIQQEIDQMGPARISDMEQARKRLCAIATQLWAAGEIHVLGKTGE